MASGILSKLFFVIDQVDMANIVIGAVGWHGHCCARQCQLALVELPQRWVCRELGDLSCTLPGNYPVFTGFYRDSRILAQSRSNGLPDPYRPSFGKQILAESRYRQNYPRPPTTRPQHTIQHPTPDQHGAGAARRHHSPHHQNPAKFPRPGQRHRRPRPLIHTYAPQRGCDSGVTSGVGRQGVGRLGRSKGGAGAAAANRLGGAARAEREDSAARVGRNGGKGRAARGRRLSGSAGGAAAAAAAANRWGKQQGRRGEKWGSS